MPKYLVLSGSILALAAATLVACNGQKEPMGVAPSTLQESATADAGGIASSSALAGGPQIGLQPAYPVYQSQETYQAFEDSDVKRVVETPVSTFAIDVDSGSYANIRRFLMNGQKPPQHAVRVEEMLNYFTYDYRGPTDSAEPFLASSDVMTTPWNANTKLLRVGIKGYAPAMDDRPPASLVFLIDVSGSMQDTDKLPLLKSSMKLLVDELGDDDKITIVTYAGNAGLVLEPTAAGERARIKAAIDGLDAGGSTAGGQGIQLAYAKAREALIEGGINRIFLATDGDFNVGVTDIGQLKEMIEEARKSGIALSTLGFGEGNYNDALMEQIADIGNGNYGYVDSLKEAKRLLVDSLGGTMMTIAKDVKIQVEFNPAVIAEYRLIGYENRALNREDFNNDATDAGEIGAGHTVTALYEIALVGSKGLSVDPLRYQAEPDQTGEGEPIRAEEFALLRLRYKAPDGNVSKLIETPLPSAWLKQARDPSADDKFAAAVAAFGQYLRGGERLGQFDLDQIAALARAGRGTDEDGYRAEFIDLVELADGVSR